MGQCFRQTTSSTSPSRPGDYKGFKSVPVSPLWTSMFKAFDAALLRSISTKSIPRSTKIVEGQEIRWH